MRDEIDAIYELLTTGRADELIDAMRGEEQAQQDAEEHQRPWQAFDHCPGYTRLVALNAADEAEDDHSALDAANDALGVAAVVDDLGEAF